MLQFVCFFAAVILTIVIGTKTKTNFGLWGLLFAMILAIVFLKTPAQNIFIKNFPTRIITVFMSAALFLGFGAGNGTISVLAHKATALVKGPKWVSLLMLYVITIIITILTASAHATVIPMALLATHVTVALGVNPFIGVYAVWAGWSCVMFLPWTAQALVNKSFFYDYLGEAASAAGLTQGLILFILYATASFLVIFFAFGGLKAKQSATEVDEYKDLKFNEVQKKTLVVFAFILIMIIVPMVIQMFAPNPVTNFLGNDLGITFWFLLGAVIMMLMGIEKSKTAILNYIPWDLVMLLVGMCVLFGEAGPLGVVDTLGNAVGHVPAWLIAPAIAAVGGLLSMFVSGSVLSPFFASLTPALAAAANVSPSFMMAAIIVGMGVSAVSPFSGAGATTLSGVDDNDIRDKCAKTMFKTACINIPIFSALIAVAQFIV